MKLHKYKPIIVSVFALNLVAGALAELLPSFDMTMMCDRAQRIVRGELDQQGVLKINLVIKGSQSNPSEAEVTFDEAMVARMRKAIGVAGGENLEVAAFLEESGRPVWGMAGIVALEERRVWMCQSGDSLGHGSFQHTVNTNFTAEAFIKKVKETLDIIVQRHVICNQKPSKERVENILEFLGGKNQYQLRQLTTALAVLGSVEEKHLLMLLKDELNSEKAGIILDLARELPFRVESYGQIAVFLDRKHAPALRGKAISALPQIDMSRVAASFVPFLIADEPLLRSFLMDLRASPGGLVKNFPDQGVIEPLFRLTMEMKKQHTEQGCHVLGNQSYALLFCLQRYAHPKFVPLVYEWALSGKHVTSNQALSTLRSITGLSYERSHRDVWHQWMEANRSTLQVNYNLSTAAGRTQWFAAWKAGDAAVQRLLMRLWLFESNPPEELLFKTASGTQGKNQGAAKLVLSRLWQHDRLSPELQKLIVVRFLNLKLVQQPAQTKGVRHLKIASHSEFPFPKNAWVQPQCAWSLNAKPPQLGNSYGEFSLHDIDKVVVGSWSGGAEDGSRVRALAEIRRVGRGAGGKVLWSHTWSFDAPSVSNVPTEKDRKQE